MKEKEQIRCGCGNLIGIRYGNRKIISKRHGREFTLPVVNGIMIVCERCGKTTEIRKEGENV